ncbi:MAG: alpha/beta hydrolase [Balneolaceae bacterium]
MNLIKTASLLFLIPLLLSIPALSQPLILPLWDGIPPFQTDLGLEELHIREGILRISNVQTPTLEAYLPDKEKATGKSVLIFPGGGYAILAYEWEGTEFARWLQDNGIAGIVVKYRLPISESLTDPKEVPLADAQRAVRLVRHHAEEWGIDPGQVGIMGFSAGGHLASTLSTQHDVQIVPATNSIDSLSARPDFSILVYPVISFRDISAHSGSRRNLLGEETTQELIDRFSSELHVNPETPPAFLIHSQDDTGVPVKNSLLYFEALTRNGVPASLHVYPTGGHGFAFGTGKGTVEEWTSVLLSWLLISD